MHRTDFSHFVEYYFARLGEIILDKNDEVPYSAFKSLTLCH